MKVNLTATCNSDCLCDNIEYNAICGSDGITYYSPCHAGCQTSHFDNQSFTYVRIILFIREPTMN